MRCHKSNAELFADARRALLGHLSIAVWSLLLVVALSFLLTQIAASFTFPNIYLSLTANLAAHFVTTLFASLFGIGLSSVFLNLLYGQPASIRCLLVGFVENPDNCVRARFYVTCGEFLCLLPLQLFVYVLDEKSLTTFLPVTAAVGILCLIAYTIWSLTFSMVNYILLDFPDMDAGRILRVSRSMMHGNRVRLLLLYFHILPLHLLGLFSFGLANIWASCCQYACVAAFYKDMMTAPEG